MCDRGGVIFIHLCDRTGIVQIVSDPERTPDSYANCDRLRNEYVVKITGRVTQRPEERIPKSQITQRRNRKRLKLKRKSDGQASLDAES